MVSCFYLHCLSANCENFGTSVVYRVLIRGKTGQIKYTSILYYYFQRGINSDSLRRTTDYIKNNFIALWIMEFGK